MRGRKGHELVRGGKPLGVRAALCSTLGAEQLPLGSARREL
jgi:hypothetical protein